MTTSDPGGAHTTIECPAHGCTWTLTPERPEVPSGALASVFGAGTMADVAMYQHHHQVEAQLREHFRTHELSDFLATITRLRSDYEARGNVIDSLKREVTQVSLVARRTADENDRLKAELVQATECYHKARAEAHGLGARVAELEAERDRLLPVVEAAKASDAIIAEMADHLDLIANQVTFHLNPDANEGAPLTDDEDTNRELLRLSERISERAAIIERPDVLTAVRRARSQPAVDALGPASEELGPADIGHVTRGDLEGIAALTNIVSRDDASLPLDEEPDQHPAWLIDLINVVRQAQEDDSTPCRRGECDEEGCDWCAWQAVIDTIPRRLLRAANRKLLGRITSAAADGQGGEGRG